LQQTVTRPLNWGGLGLPVGTQEASPDGVAVPLSPKVGAIPVMHTLVEAPPFGVLQLVSSHALMAAVQVPPVGALQEQEGIALQGTTPVVAKP